MPRSIGRRLDLAFVALIAVVATAALAELRSSSGHAAVPVALGVAGVIAVYALLTVRAEVEEWRRAERARAESDARFRAAVDGSLDAFYILRSVRDARGAITDFEF